MTRPSPLARRAAATTGAAALALSTVAVGAPGAQADVPTDSRLAFGAALDGDEAAHLYSLVPGQEEPVQITEGERDEMQPAWSPDGEELLFVSFELGPPNLYRVPASGGEPEPVTANTGNQAHPGWSPDGERIVYQDHSIMRPPETNGIYTNSPEGDDPVQLNEGGRYPDWDPGGEWISSVHEEDEPDTWTIRWTAPDGGDGVDVHTRQGWEITGPEFSPDGAHLAFREERLADGSVSLNVMDRDSHEVHTVLAEDGGVGNPVWSPDGERLAFTSLRPDGRGIYTLDVSDPADPGETAKVFDLPDGQWPELDWAAG